MNFNRKKLRAVLIAIIFIIIAIMSILHFSIEPADYKAEIKKQNTIASELINKAVEGNDNGEYSHNSILRLKAVINHCEKLIAQTAPNIEEQAAAYNFAKKEINIFKDAANKNSISKADVLKYKNDKTNIVKQQKIGTDEIQLTISYEGINDPISVNFDVKLDGMYSARINNLLESEKIKGFPIEFEHSGNFPGRMDVSISSEKIPDTAYLYRYNRNENSIDYICGVITDKTNVYFSITAGDDFVITDKAPAKDNDVDKEISLNDKVDKEESSSALKSSSTPNKVTSKPVKPAKKPIVSSNAQVSSNVSSTTEQAFVSSQKSEETETSPNHDLTIDSVLPSSEQKPVKKNKCTVEIRCDTLLGKLDKLDKGLEKYVPANGEILAAVEVEFTDGETAFDIIKRATRSFNIQMEFRDDPTYSGAYIEGINHLYELSCGAGSGWMYMVNGWFPNYGCSQYAMQNGDSMIWCYTCDVGQDVGKG